jgi:hypothetical protein
MSHVLLARVKTLTGRDLRGHDIEAEKMARNSISTVHYYEDEHKYHTTSWKTHFKKHTEKLIHQSLTAENTYDQNTDKWTKTRALWLPQGTSSLEKSAGKQPLIERWATDKAVPRTKKMAWLNRPMELDSILKREPAIECRAATKNEPGRKRRPLHAADDYSFLAASYVSSGLEKTMSIGGAVMRQRPSDVQETAKAVEGNQGMQWILCIDYSDFNKTHTIYCRHALAKAIADRFEQLGCTERARAARWMARAHLSHTLNGTLVNQGLSSGERDTARDNTLLHVVYSRMAIEVLEQDCPTLRSCMKRFCGDDEIMIGLDWYDAIMYTKQLELQGHKLQKRKVMLSKQCGEFLQYNFSLEQELPRQPLAPALVNFVSGSWYKRSVYSEAALPQQVSDSAAGLVRRGLDAAIAAKLAIASCNWLCKNIDWKTALQNTNLFGAKQLEQTPPEKTEEQVFKPKLELATIKGIRDFENWVIQQYPGLLGKVSFGQVNRDLLRQAYGSYIGRATKLKHTSASVATEKIELPETQAVMGHELKRKWLTADAGERVDPMELLAMQAGLPIQWLKGKEAKDIIAEMPNSVLKKVHIQPESAWKVTPIEMAMLPGAIAPYARV